MRVDRYISLPAPPPLAYPSQLYSCTYCPSKYGLPLPHIRLSRLYSLCKISHRSHPNTKLNEIHVFSCAIPCPLHSSITSHTVPRNIAYPNKSGLGPIRLAVEWAGSHKMDVELHVHSCIPLTDAGANGFTFSADLPTEPTSKRAGQQEGGGESLGSVYWTELLSTLNQSSVSISRRREDGFGVKCENGEMCWRPMVTTHWPRLFSYAGIAMDGR